MPRTALFLAAALLAGSAFGAAASDPADFNQAYRPQFHFSPQRNWTNDPNGPVFFEGEYHLFFQYNPFGDLWGHMSWGHAVSPDLVHWQELPVAIPEENGVMIFTGSTVVDEHNTSGFCKNGKACMVAVYTAFTPASGGRKAVQAQSIAYSNDRGRTWTKYAGNPVLDLHMSDFRDPKVLWSEEAKGWVMAVALPQEHKVRIYGSPNLKTWKALSDFGPAGATGGVWECPEFFQLPVDGKPGQTRWVMKVGLNPGALQGGSGEQYFVGRFDGKEFKNDNPASLTLWADSGKDCYCGLTFNNLPKTQNPVMIGWMSNWQYADKLPTSPWHGQMTLAKRLTLRETADGIRLFQAPVEGMKNLEGKTETISTKKATPLQTETYKLRSIVDLGGAAEAGWKISSADGTYTLVGYDKEKSRLYVDRTHSGTVKINDKFPARLEAPLTLKGPVTMELLVDRSSIELFADNGAVTMTNLVFPNAGMKTVEFYSKGGHTGEVKASLTELKSAH